MSPVAATVPDLLARDRFGAKRMGFECSAIRHYGRSTDRAIGIAWKAIGWLPTGRKSGLPDFPMMMRNPGKPGLRCVTDRLHHFFRSSTLG